jgi:transposase InsO family protein
MSNPSKPSRNGYVESFNSRIRDECLNINSFWSMAQARVVISDWKHEYNHHPLCQPELRHLPPDN